MIYFPYIQKSSSKEYANMYDYFQEMMGEAMIPFVAKIFTSTRDISSKLINLYRSENPNLNNNFSESLNPLEAFL